MPLFLAHFTIVSQPSEAALAAAGAVTQGLFTEGYLRQLVVAEDFSQGWASWRVDSPEQLQQQLEALPLRTHLATTCLTQLAYCLGRKPALLTPETALLRPSPD